MQKTKPIRVRMTEQEVKALEEISKEETGKINISKVIRKSIRDYVGFGPHLIDSQMTDFRLAIRQLTGISRNFNQVTRAINSNPNNLSKITQNKLDELSISVDKLNQSLINIVKHTKDRKGAPIGQ